MRIKSLKVSNILSYKFLDDFDNAGNTIEFKDDLNILIGSNGSGKSNLLEIINKLFQGHFFEYYFINDNALFNINVAEKVVRVNQDRKNQVQNTLLKHFDYPDLPSTIQIALVPDKGDIENLLIILKNSEELKAYYKKYCDSNFFIEQFTGLTELDIKGISVVEYKFNLNNNVNISTVNFELIPILSSRGKTIFYYYLQYFNQVQTLLEVVNLNESTKWKLLKSPFALISSMRQYGGFATSFSTGVGLNEQVKQADQNEGNQSTKNYVGTDYIFRITLIKLGQLFRKFRDFGGISYAQEQLLNNQDSLLPRINSLLLENLGFTLKVENYNQGNDTLMIKIYEGRGVINFNELSMGQKSIFYLLFAVYGYDIKDGLLIVDEPELHLHVSMQKKYFKILKEVCKKANIQIIIATHSGIFIDEKTIKNTFRFFKKNKETEIVCPTAISQNQKDLIKILTYTNSSRIFFADKVLLVEGDSDEYFFSFFYENYIKSKKVDEVNIEILYIGGKGAFLKWRSFLTLFKIESFFIGDFDNIKEFGIATQIGLNLKEISIKSNTNAIAKVLKERIDKPSLDGKELLNQLEILISKGSNIKKSDFDHLKKLWIYLIEKQGLKKNHIIDFLHERKNLHYWKKMENAIKQRYTEGIFILKDGDLEDYLNISHDLTGVIKFCQNDFTKWIAAESNKGVKSKVFELESIFEIILDKNTA